MRLKVGTFASSGAGQFFAGIVNWLIGADGGKLFVSEDGLKFAEVISPFGSSNVNDVIYSDDLSSPGNQVFLAAGNDGKLAKSSDGLSWSTINTGDTTNINVVSYGGESFLPVGIIWTTVNSNFNTTDVLSIAYGNGLWVAGGASGQMRISTDGATWTTVTANFGTTWIYFVAYDNGLWVAGGQGGQIRTSTNGSTWTTVNSNVRDTWILSVAYGNGLWVAGGQGGQMRTYTQEQLNLNKFIKSQDEEKATFLNNDGILFNWNGIGYERINTGINDNFVNGSIRNNGGTYEYIIQGNNALYHSTDLTTWTTISKPPASDVNDIIGKS